MHQDVNLTLDAAHLCGGAGLEEDNGTIQCGHCEFATVGAELDGKSVS